MSLTWLCLNSIFFLFNKMHIFSVLAWRVESVEKTNYSTVYYSIARTTNWSSQTKQMGRISYRCVLIWKTEIFWSDFLSNQAWAVCATQDRSPGMVWQKIQVPKSKCQKKQKSDGMQSFSIFLVQRPCFNIKVNMETIKRI